MTISCALTIPRKPGLRGISGEERAPRPLHAARYFGGFEIGVTGG